MTKKDFELIAEVIREAGQGSHDKETIRNMAWRFEVALRRTNNRFNGDRFLRACGVED